MYESINKEKKKLISYTHAVRRPAQVNHLDTTLRSQLDLGFSQRELWFTCTDFSNDNKVNCLCHEKDKGILKTKKTSYFVLISACHHGLWISHEPFSVCNTVKCRNRLYRKFYSHSIDFMTTKI